MARKLQSKALQAKQRSRIRIEAAGRLHRRHLILGNGQHKFHAAHVAALMNTVDLHAIFFVAVLSPAVSTPRLIWSRSRDSNSALKFPSPKPSR